MPYKMRTKQWGDYKRVIIGDLCTGLRRDRYKLFSPVLL